jgi:hypothetical protein
VVAFFAARCAPRRAAREPISVSEENAYAQMRGEIEGIAADAIASFSFALARLRFFGYHKGY